MWRISNTSVDSLSICLLNYIFFFFFFYLWVEGGKKCKAQLPRQRSGLAKAYKSVKVLYNDSKKCSVKIFCI